MSKTTDLVYRLIGNSDPFSKELQRAEKDVSKFQRRAESDIAKVGKAFAVLGAAAASALAVAVKQSINAADELGKLSDRVGVSTEDLSGLGFAAEQSGTNLEVLGKSFRDLNRSLAESEHRTNKGSIALGRLNVQTKNADGGLRSSADILRDVSDRFAVLENGAQKTAFAIDIFGKSGEQLIPLLNEGSDGIKELTDKAAELGLVIKDDTARQAALFNDNLAVLGKTFRGIANQVASQVLPILVQWSNRAIDGANDAGTFAGSLNTISTAVKVLVGLIDVTVATFQVFGLAIGAVAAFVVDSSDVMIDRMTIVQRSLFSIAKGTAQIGRGQFLDAIKTIADGTKAINKTIKSDLSGSVAIFEKAFDDISQITTNAGERLADTFLFDAPPIVTAARATGELAGKAFGRGLATSLQAETTNALGKQIQSAQSIIEKASEDARKANQRLLDSLTSDADRVYRNTRTALEVYTTELENLDRLLSLSLISQETYNRAVIQLDENLDGATRSQRVLTEAVVETAEEFSNFGQRGAEAAFDALERSLFDPAQRGFKQMAENFALALLKMAADAAKQEALKALFAGIAAPSPVAAVTSFADGGYVSGPGTSRSDSIPARLSNGEFVVNASAVQYHGIGKMNAINQKRRGFADGGLAQSGGGDVSIINVLDPSVVEDFLLSSRGQRVIVNAISSNKMAVR